MTLRCRWGHEAWVDKCPVFGVFWVARCPKCLIATEWHNTREDAIRAWVKGETYYIVSDEEAEAP